MTEVRGYAAHDASSPLAPFTFERREPGPHDVQIEILYAASAIPTCTRRTTTGAIRSIRWCRATRSSAGWSRSAPKSRSSKWAIWPGSAAWSIPAAIARPAKRTWSNIARRARPGPTTAKERETASSTRPSAAIPNRSWSRNASSLKIPENLDLKAVAPLLCAGITTWSPLRHWKVGRGPEGRRHRPGRPRPYGRQIRQGAGRPCGDDHHLARKRARTPRGSAPTRC